MRDALNATGRPIFYSLCNWGEEGVTNWGPEVGNSFRTTQDIADFWTSIEANFRISQYSHDIASPGSWNDPDMLEVGNGGLTFEEEKTHFGLWSIAKAPLILGCDLTKISKESFSVITNKEVIDINQDEGAPQARCVHGCDWWSSLMRYPSVWATKLSNGDRIAAVVNWRLVNWHNFKLDVEHAGLAPKASDQITVRDLFDKRDVLTISGEDVIKKHPITIDMIPGHGIKIYKFSTTKNTFEDFDEFVEEEDEDFEFIQN